LERADAGDAELRVEADPMVRGKRRETIASRWRSKESGHGGHSIRVDIDPK